MENFTTIAEVDRIAAMTDATLRNNQITRSYHQLSLAFSKHTGPWANWCTFATWASRQAGQTIRGEDFAAALETKLRMTPAISHAISRVAEIALLKGAAIDKDGLIKLIWETINPKGALDQAIGRLTALARHHIRLLLTEHLMELHFPKKRLKLGDDLEAVSFPPLLKTLTHPELTSLLAQIDPTPDSLKATGAVDWADLYDRLHFIADMFRCYQEDEDLFLAP